ncbi:DUF4179 domain-containing protein [Ureibacillus chungkukjangi]|uniref:DUF4179 domain-containing protein n=1 Tax=Ureibacillus chungkukjangi TaxID=1202712 RepID=UPI00384F8C00
MTEKEWLDLDIDQLELLDVTEFEKTRVKQYVVKKRKKTSLLRNIAVASIIIISATTASGFAFPSLASQLPFMNNVIQLFNDEEHRYEAFEDFSTDFNLTQSSNGITIMIDDAVYDGTNITVTYAIETEHDFGETMQEKAPNWFDVTGSHALDGTEEIKRISDTSYIGISTFTPSFENDVYPEKVEVTWTPKAFISLANDLEVKGDWSFSFSLERLKGNLQHVNQTVGQEGINFTLQTIEFTDVSTVITYEQVVTDELVSKWPMVTPTFRIKDNLGHVYVDGTNGGGVSRENGKLYNGTTGFGKIQDGASQLIITPIEIASEMSGLAHTEIELEPIVIDLK